MIFQPVMVILAYLLGSMPTAYIFGKVFKGIDIREYGSGNVGATNVFRTIGKGYGLVVFIIDFLKGFLAVVLMSILYEKITSHPADEVLKIFVAGAAISGHIWTVFLNFKGGKGVATSAGVMAALDPLILLIALMIWVIIFSLWKYVSLASILAALSLPVSALILERGTVFIIFGGVLCLVGVYGHRSNIRRLLQGTENKLLNKKKPGI